MFTNISTPPSFSLIKKGKVLLLVREDYKDFLLRQGIEDLDDYLTRHRQNSRYLSGRSLHPSIPIQDGKRIVLRQYSHGGLLRGVTRNLYLLGARSFQELALTEEIRSCGIPTIEPIGAIHRLIFPPLYRACLISLEVPQAVDMTQFLLEIGPHPAGQNLSLKRKTIRSAGLLLRQFHQAGFFHGDLQLKNFLVAGGQPLLIDFDRSYRKEGLSARKRTKNLLRLNRSAEKWRHHGLFITWRDRWRFFLAYAGDDLKIQKTMRRAMRAYSLRSLFYRWGWALEGIVTNSRGLRIPGFKGSRDQGHL